MQGMEGHKKWGLKTFDSKNETLTTCIFSLHLAFVLNFHDNKLYWECMKFDVVPVYVTGSYWMLSFWFLSHSPQTLLKAVHTARLYGVCPSVCLSLSYSRGMHTAVNCLLLLVNSNCTVEKIYKYLLSYKV